MLSDPTSPLDDDIAISVRSLTKTYRLFNHPGERIKQFLSLGLKQYHREFSALKNLSFDIKKGATVGIIGRNGSGKSTLLQLICGILKPTNGSVRINGRVSALLELGAGFNPEFTGRENVYFQGALMGFTQEQMEARFDAISNFAEIGDFIEQPVRTYSSGMFLRLAFAVAINVDPNVLVVDEAIAVGDSGFRARCFRRIVELRNSGCTILFVSHSMEQILMLCDSSILLDLGEMVFHGNSALAVQGYNQLIGNTEADQKTSCYRGSEKLALGNVFEPFITAQLSDKTEDRDNYFDTLQADSLVTFPPNGAVIENIGVYSLDGERLNLLRTGNRYQCRYQTRFSSAAQSVRFAAMIRTRSGVDLGGAWSAPRAIDGIADIRAGNIAEIEFEFDCRLHPGDYQINLAVFARDNELEYIMHGVIGAVGFRVESPSDSYPLAHTDFSCRTNIHMHRRTT